MMQRVCAVALLVALLGAVLSELGFKSRKLFSILAVLMILISLADSLSSLWSKIGGLAEMTGISEAAECALKAVGTGYVFGFVSTVLSELGEITLASAVCIACRVEVIIIVLPFIEKTVRLGIELLQ